MEQVTSQKEMTPKNQLDPGVYTLLTKSDKTVEMWDNKGKRG